MKKNSTLSKRIEMANHRLAYFKMIMPENVKPNFSEISRETGLSRHTVSKAWKKMNRSTTDSEPKKRKSRPSKFDPYKDEIIEILKDPANKIKAAFMYLKCIHGEEVFNNYNSFKAYVRTHNLMEYRKMYRKAHPRFETDAAVQAQFDWKENLKFELDTGEIIEFNLFTGLLSYSRYTWFVYTKTKTKEDLIRCLIEFLREIGGVPEHFLTDNMSAVVYSSSDHARRKKHPEILQLEKDLDAPIELCDPGSCETKGKVESANRFASWLSPFQKKLHTEEELIEVIQRLNELINQEVNETTKVPRKTLFAKEKKYLRPLPSNVVLESYIKDVTTQIVPSTMLVKYKGSGYSVPKKFIGKRVKIVPINDELYIYFNSDLIATHKISQKPMNYRLEDYEEGLRDRFSKKISDDEVHKRAEKNLKLLDKVGSHKPKGELKS